jgi:acetyl esterase/lipase
LRPGHSFEQLPAFFGELTAWAEGQAVPAEIVRYGGEPDQELELRLPEGPGPHRVVIVLHGGFWRAGFTRANTAALAVALTQAGWATANVEYRRLGPGAYRPMLDDVTAASRRLRELVDLDDAVAIGHSAGGQLALWLAAWGGARSAVALGGVCDLAAAAKAHIGTGAVVEFLGGPPETAGPAYDEADPARLLPLGVRQLLIHGAADDRVPLELARAYAERACAAGDDCRLLELRDADHFDLIDPRHAVWGRIVGGIDELAQARRRV